MSIPKIRAALDAGDLETAERLAREVIDANSKDALAHAYLASVLVGKGVANEALTHYRAAVAIQPSEAIFHNELGNALARLGEFEEAERSLREAVKLSDASPEINNNLGNILRGLGRHLEAIEQYQEALRLRPDYSEAQTNLGVALQEVDNLTGARAAYEAAIAMDPSNAFAYSHLGLIAASEGRLSEAETLHRKALEIAPGAIVAQANLGVLLKDQGRLKDAQVAYVRAMELDPHDAGLHSNLLLTQCFDPTTDEKMLYAAHRAYGERQETNREGSFVVTPREDRRLRIGYVSSDFYAHSVASFIEPVIKAHDRARFCVTCYSNLLRGDHVTARLKSVAEVWRDIKGTSSSELFNMIRADGIDILVDLSGHTANNSLPVFARRAAPVQVSWIGYPATTGLSRMDYRVTDNWADPKGVSDQWHSEALLRLDSCFLCYEGPSEAPDPGIDRSGPTTYGSFNNYSKINDGVVDLWATLLVQEPEARLLLKSRQFADIEVRDRLIAAFEAKGVAKRRLELHGRIEAREDHFAHYWAIDVALDTFPYNGTTTTCEALWMGVPVVSLRGDRHAARVGASLLSAAGKSEWIAETPLEYVEIARKLDKSRPFRADLRAALSVSLLMDARHHVSALENAYCEIWKRYQRAGEVNVTN